MRKTYTIQSKEKVKIKKPKLIFLKSKDLPALRKVQLKKQNNTCPILKMLMLEKEAVLDHKHKLKHESCGGPEGLGCLRGVIHNNANVFEGKVTKLWKRYGLSKYIDLAPLLRNLADYLENPPMKPIYVHPKEREKREILSKPDYRRICKYYFLLYPNKKALPKYTKYKDKWIDLLCETGTAHNLKKIYSKEQKELIKKGQRLYKEIKK